MTMLGRIIRREMLEHLMSLRFAIACVLCFVVILCSLFVRYHDYSNALSDYYEDSSAEDAALRAVSEPGELVFSGVVVRQKPNPLKIFVRGLEDGHGTAVTVNANEPVRMETTATLHPVAPLFPAMDYLYFVGVILSLMVIVFAYDAVCGERERGTLRLMLSYSVPRDAVLLGKWIGGYLSLILPFLLAIVSGATVVLVMAEEPLSTSQWLKMFSIVALSLVYIATMYSIALWVSTMTAQASTSVMVLVTAWMLLVLAIPNISPYLAQAWRPTDSPIEMEAARRKAAEDINRRLLDEPTAAYDREHGFERRWRRNVNMDDPATRQRVQRRQMFYAQCYASAALERLRTDQKTVQDYQAQLDAQVSLSRWLARISPFACFALATTELTDTGLLSRRHWSQQVQKYQLDLAKYALEEYERFTALQLDSPEQAPDWRRERGGPIPTFAHRDPATAAYARAVVVDAGILVALAIVFFMLSYLCFLRYDVR